MDAMDYIHEDADQPDLKVWPPQVINISICHTLLTCGRAYTTTRGPMVSPTLSYFIGGFHRS